MDSSFIGSPFLPTFNEGCKFFGSSPYFSSSSPSSSPSSPPSPPPWLVQSPSHTMIALTLALSEESSDLLSESSLVELASVVPTRVELFCPPGNQLLLMSLLLLLLLLLLKLLPGWSRKLGPLANRIKVTVFPLNTGKKRENLRQKLKKTCLLYRKMISFLLRHFPP